jgi:acyl-CoA thioesterase
MTVTGGSPIGYRAVASWNGTVVADSTAATRTDIPDSPPLLWFPIGDVDAGALDQLDPAWWRRGEGETADHVSFDHDALDLRLEDDRADDGGCGPTVYRFPTWGDSTDLIGLLDVRQVDSGLYRSETRNDWRRPVLEGSQLLGQAVVAASRHAPGRRVVLASMIFTRPVSSSGTYDFELDPVAEGRTFTGLQVKVTQGGRVCAAGTLLLDVTAPALVSHADPQPPASGPDEAAPYDMSVTGRDLRIVDDAYTGDPDAALGPPVLDTWVRFRDVPADPPIHAGLMCQFMGHMPIAASLRPHAGIGQDQAHRSISTAINAITVSLHAEVHADAWMRYHHRSTFAGDGMSHSVCSVHDQGGRPLASFTVEAMVRGFADATRNVDERTAL